MSKRIVAIDPGVTTGLAILDALGPDAEGRQQIDIIYAAQITWDKRFSIERHIKDQYTDFIVIESFNLRPEKAQALGNVRSGFEVVELIGMVVAWSAQANKPLFRQTPAMRKSVKLPHRHNLLVNKPHAQDAYRHGRYFIVSKAKEIFEA